MEFCVLYVSLDFIRNFIIMCILTPKITVTFMPHHNSLRTNPTHQDLCVTILLWGKSRYTNFMYLLSLLWLPEPFNTHKLGLLTRGSSWQAQKKALVERTYCKTLEPALCYLDPSIVNKLWIEIMLTNTISTELVVLASLVPCAMKRD